GLLVHADDDVEIVFDRSHEIHDRQAVELKIVRETGLPNDLDTLLVEGSDDAANARIDFGSVHGEVPKLGLRRKRGWARKCQAYGAIATLGRLAETDQWRPAW